MPKVSAYVNEEDVEELKKLIKQGKYKSLSDAVRTALQELIESHKFDEEYERKIIKGR
jgi:Arc/MetJ-type ribon-helix-helix transcriptional regulator